MRSAIRFAALVALLATVSCSALTPKTYQLEQIHETYTAEWARAKLPDPNTLKPSQPSEGKAFEATLAAIRNYKATYGNADAVAAHLTVLEGMIHLQSGYPGMARLLEKDIKEQSKRLESGSGVSARDKLFAACYPALVKGWDAIFNKSVDPKEFTDAADALVKTLKGAKPDERAAAEVDSGGAYIATSAAIFYLWSSSIDLTIPRKRWAEKGAAALKPWMSAREVEAVEAEQPTWNAPGMNWGSRQRFVEWYAWLHAQSQ